MKKLIAVFVFLSLQTPMVFARPSNDGFGGGTRRESSNRADNSERDRSGKNSGFNARKENASGTNSQPRQSAAAKPQTQSGTAAAARPQVRSNAAPAQTRSASGQYTRQIRRTQSAPAGREPRQYRTNTRYAAPATVRPAASAAVVARPAALPAGTMYRVSRPSYAMRPMHSAFRPYYYRPFWLLRRPASLFSFYFFPAYPSWFFSYSYFYPYPYFYSYPFFPSYTASYSNTFFDYGTVYDSGNRQQTNEDYAELNELAKKQYHYEAEMESLAGIAVTDVQFYKNPYPVITMTITNNTQYSITNINFECAIKDGETSFGQSFGYLLPETLRPRAKRTYSIDLSSYREWNMINLSTRAQMAVYVDGITNDQGTAIPQDI
ncbi:MAG: hypothetical protein FWC57_03415, partial [Endomicrobia bacterium]|nr:hypothetical protein [Endomicrobiia bacterium]